MAISRDTLRLLDGMRISMNEPLDAAAERILLAWASAWNELAAEWDAALADLIAASDDGQWPSRRQIARAKRAQQALEMTRQAIFDLAGDLPVTATQALPAMTQDAADWSRRLAASQYPPQAGTAAQVAATFGRLDTRALAAIVKRTTEQITSLSLPLTDQMDRAMRSALIRGMAVGDNPRAVARDMLARLEGVFNGGRNRALVIARTELLDAYRAANMLGEDSMKDVLQGWTWAATLDRRTCPSCWGMHGSEHKLTEPGPIDHQQGRCARLPLTKSWKDLGYAVPEPASLLPDARSRLDGLSREDQLLVMGKARLELLDSGAIDLADLSTRKSTAGWRDSMTVTPLADLRAKAAA